MSNPRIIRVLVVDDEKIIRDLLTRSLEIAGCIVTTAEDGLEGLEKAESHIFDVVISDIKMPRMDGITMVREILDRKPKMPVLMITGYAEDDCVTEAKKLGVVDTIVKPFRNTAIINSINKALMRKAREESDGAGSI